MPTTLSTPTITATVIDRTKIKIDGLSVQNASGYQVRIGTLSGGLPSFTVTPENGSVTFDKRLPRSVYYIQARALGDDENYDTSDWCAEISVQTGQIIDGEMGVPSVSISAVSLSMLTITGLTAQAEYRYQIATSENDLAISSPRCFGSNNGIGYIGNLEPGTTYYLRFCVVSGERCSLWGATLSATTKAVGNTIVVTSGADSGTGTLRAAVTSASNYDKIVLDVDTITLNTVIQNTSKPLYIVGGRTNRTIIQSGNNNRVLYLSASEIKHCQLRGACGSSTIAYQGVWSDCVFTEITATSDGFVNAVKAFNCEFSSSSSNRYGVCNCLVYDSVIKNNTSNGDGNYGLLAVNCIVMNNTSAGNGGGVTNSTLFNTCVIGNSATGTNGVGSGGGVYFSHVIGSSVIANTAKGNGGGAYGASTYKAINSVFLDNEAGGSGGGINSMTSIGCVIERNKAGTSGGGQNTGVITDCVIRDNYSIGYGGGLYQGVATNCTIIGNYSVNGGGGCNNSTLTDCTIENNESAGIGGISGGSALRCTISNNKGVNTVGGVGQATCTDCIISGNTGGGVVNGVYGGTLIGCLVTGHSLGCCSSNLTSSLIVGNYSRDYFMSNNLPACTIRNSTIGKGNAVSVNFAPKLTIYNSLYQSLSATPATSGGNIAYGNNDSDYFIDAANGDYRLKPGSLAIEQGNNSYVTGTMTTDLAGNPRISGTNVDVGCYEFVPVQLPTPILYLNAGHDQATIYFTLPPYCNGYLIEHADNPDFTGALTTTATSTGFLLPGLSGETYIRAKYVGVSGKTLDSEWSEVYEHYFDVTAPTVIVNALYDPIIMTVGDSIDLFSGVTVTDDYDELVIPTYEILDGDNETVEIGGETIDLPSNVLPVGNYTIKYTATDQAENTATSLRSLSVRPPVLDTPVIAYHSSTTDTITVSGVLDEFADGWEVEVNGSVSTATPNSAGLLLVSGLRVTNLYNIKVKAIGNGITTSDSDWSNTVIASPSPAVIAYSDIHIKNAPTGQFSAVRKIDLDSRVPTGGEYGEVIVWGTNGPEWTPGVIPIWRVVNGE